MARKFAVVPAVMLAPASSVALAVSWALDTATDAAVWVGSGGF